MYCGLFNVNRKQKYYWCTDFFNIEYYSGCNADLCFVENNIYVSVFMSAGV